MGRNLPARNFPALNPVRPPWFRGSKRKLLVRRILTRYLARAKPHFADEDVRQRLVVHLQRSRLRARRHRVKFDQPFPARIRRPRFGLPGKFDGHFRTGVGPTPDRDGLLALQDHVIGKKRPEFQFGRVQRGNNRESVTRVRPVVIWPGKWWRVRLNDGFT